MPKTPKSPSNKVTPGAEDTPELSKGAAIRAVEHLATCTQWKSGLCPFEGCAAVAKILHHSETCPSRNGTIKEQLRELYKQNAPGLAAKGDNFIDKQLHTFKGREHELLENALATYNLAPKWCKICKQATRLQKTHSRNCDRDVCHVPRCALLRGGDSAAQRAAAEAIAEKARHDAQFTPVFPPFCCLKVHKASMCAAFQQWCTAGFQKIAFHTPTDDNGKITVDCMQASACCFVFMVLLPTFVLLFSGAIELE